MLTPGRAAARSAAILSLLYAAGATAMAAGLTLHLLQGHPLASPFDLFDPRHPLLTPGERFPLPGGSLLVTSEVVRLAALLSLLIMAVAGLAWSAAAVGLWRERWWGRLLGMGLLSLTVVLGALNLAALGLTVVVLGALPEPAALLLPLAVVGLGFLACPGAVLLWLWLDRAAARSPGRQPLPWLRLSLQAHFYLAGALLCGAALLPAAILAPRLLAGPWLWQGWVARLTSLVLGAAHLAAAAALGERGDGEARLAVGLTWLLTAAAATSAALAGDAVLSISVGGVVPAVLARVMAGLMVPLGLVLLLTLRAERRRRLQPAAAAPVTPPRAESHPVPRPPRVPE